MDTQPAHEDYCRIIGRIVIDTFLRIESLEKTHASLRSAYKAELEKLRHEVDTADINKLREGLA